MESDSGTWRDGLAATCDGRGGGGAGGVWRGGANRVWSVEGRGQRGVECGGAGAGPSGVPADARVQSLGFQGEVRAGMLLPSGARQLAWSPGFQMLGEGVHLLGRRPSCVVEFIHIPFRSVPHTSPTSAPCKAPCQSWATVS